MLLFLVLFKPQYIRDPTAFLFAIKAADNFGTLKMHGFLIFTPEEESSKLFTTLTSYTLDYPRYLPIRASMHASAVCHYSQYGPSFGIGRDLHLLFKG